ncbi:MAG: Gfo/Idh/MocA family oxidoreductase [Armatimonadetes bacterium]|nr:Gfo/Idh/MocA family oxidoreductase [Armatimonadota bacterium]
MPHHYESYEELLSDDTVDAVTIASPIGLHYDQGIQAVRAGKHIHFNKTMTTTVDEADRLINEAEARGVKLVSSPGQMLRPHNQAIRKLIQDGAIGKISWATTGAAFGTYHEKERVRTGTDVLSNVDPSWYYRKPGGGPLYDMTVYGLHSLTGVLGPAKRVTAMSGVGLCEREFNGKMVPCDMDDNTLILVDFGNVLFAFVYGTFAGSISEFGSPSYFGEKGSITGTKMNGQPIEFPGAGQDSNSLLPHVKGQHQGMEEAHVWEDIMQLVDLVLDGTPTPSNAEHARHVIDIIESAYRSSDTGQAQDLRTTFEPMF